MGEDCSVVEGAFSFSTNLGLSKGRRFWNLVQSGLCQPFMGRYVESSTVPLSGFMPGTTGKSAYGSFLGGAGVGSFSGSGSGVGSFGGGGFAMEARVRFFAGASVVGADTDSGSSLISTLTGEGSFTWGGRGAGDVT